MMTFKKSFLVVCAFIMLFEWGCTEKDPSLMITKELNEDWTFRQSGKDNWMPATVPGTVHTDLMENNVIEDPFYRLNEHDVQWIDKEDWEYKTTFNADKSMLNHDRIALDFKGLDTYADVYVNNEKVLTADNMFREWKADVKEALKEGENELRIVFHSPIKEGHRKIRLNGLCYSGFR